MNVHSRLRLGSDLVSLVNGANDLLMIHDPRIIRVRVEAVDVLEMPVDACFSLASVGQARFSVWLRYVLAERLLC